MLKRGIKQELDLKPLSFDFHLTPISYHAVVNKYDCYKKTKMINALILLRTRGLQTCDSRVRLMLKQEKVFDLNKPPRAIQYRRTEYNIALAAYLFPYEHALYHHDDGRYPSFAKSYNLEDRAKLIQLKWNKFMKPIVYQMDYSKFDSHVTEQHLKCEHAMYLDAYGGDRHLAWLLKQQLTNIGITKHGTRYVTKGKRMSGDMNTGLGNSLINYLVLRRMTEHAEYFIDGDDCLLITESRTKVDFNVPRQYGFELKVKTTDKLSGVSFCSTNLMVSTCMMVREPEIVVSKHATTFRRLHPDSYRRLLRSIGECEVAVNRGVPVMQAFGLKLMTAHSRALYDPECEMKRMKMPVTLNKVTLQARLEYADIFPDWPVHRQISFERSIFTPDGEINLEYNGNLQLADIINGISTSKQSTSIEESSCKCWTPIELDVWYAARKQRISKLPTEPTTTSDPWRPYPASSWQRW